MSTKAEAYKHGLDIIVVHERHDEYVLGHTQLETTNFVTFDAFFRMEAAAFDAMVAGLAPYDTTTLPALQA